MVYVPVPLFFTNILPDKDIENSIFEIKGKLEGYCPGEFGCELLASSC